MKQSLMWPDSITERIYTIRAELMDTCTICDGTGYLPAKEGQVYRCDCLVVFRWVKELIKAGIPKDYWHLSLETLDIEQRVKKFIATYVNNILSARRNGLGMVLMGSNGTGKTSLMAEVAKHALSKLYTVRYFSMDQYITALYKKDMELVAWMEAGDFLLIDELEKQQNTKTTIKTIDEFMRRMFNAGKCLLIGTNWTKERIQSALGESTFSLFQRRNKFVLVSGEDYSVKMNDDYQHRLKGDFDYYHGNIMGWATVMESGSWQK